MGKWINRLGACATHKGVLNVRCVPMIDQRMKTRQAARDAGFGRLPELETCRLA